MSNEDKAAIEGKEHELKIWPQYFDDVESGRKPFEVRKLDRLFDRGDILWLREWSPVKGYSGRETRKKVTYLMPGGHWGLLEGNCIMGLASPVQGISKEGWNEACKKVLSELAATFIDPDNLAKAEYQDKAVFMAIGETIQNFPIPQYPGASSPSSSKGEDKVFTQKDGLDIWSAGFTDGVAGMMPFENDNKPPDKQQYFKEKFGIDI